MLNHVRHCRVILFVLGLLPSVIVNLSTNYHHDPLDIHRRDEPAFESSRILPGGSEVSKEYQIELPVLLNHHQDESESSKGPDGAQAASSEQADHRYQLIGISSYRPEENENFVTKPSKIIQPEKGSGNRWNKNMLDKSLIKRKTSEHNFPLKKLPMGYEATDQLVVDDKYRGEIKKPLHQDGLRSGYYYDSYGDWHHNGGGGAGNGDHTSAVGSWSNGLADVGSFGGSPSNGHGYHLTGWHFLNPLLLVGTLSFVINLINAVLGLVDKIKLPFARVDRAGTLEHSRVEDDEQFLNELGKLYDSIHYSQKRV